MQQTRSSDSVLARKILPQLASHPIRSDLKRRQKRPSRVLRILLGYTVLHLYELIRIYHRKNLTALWVSHSKATRSDVQH